MSEDVQAFEVYEARVLTGVLRRVAHYMTYPIAVKYCCREGSLLAVKDCYRENLSVAAAIDYIEGMV